MEPLLIAEGSRFRAELSDLAIDLVAKSAAFKAGLPPALLEPLAQAVRAMNCYYSNLIEGHDTHPIDIERALKSDYSADPRKRDLQLEARAHIAVQQWIDEGALDGRAFSVAAAREVHERFCAMLPEHLMWIADDESGERIKVAPGEFRERDVRVGKHVPISSGAIPRFMARFEEVFSRAGRAEAIVGTASAHHRLLWIHPFLDGNGRVARLTSHAQLLELIDTGGIWSVARGFARDVTRYKALLSNCDLQRRNDLDGRGNLSEEALAEFTRFFLKTCLDQVQFMASLMQPDRFRSRVLVWAAEEIKLGNLPVHADRVLEALLYRGELTRSGAASVLGLHERSARRITSVLLKNGVLTSDTHKASLKLAFPAALASRWMPGLFPEAPS